MHTRGVEAFNIPTFLCVWGDENREAKYEQASIGIESLSLSNEKTLAGCLISGMTYYPVILGLFHKPLEGTRS